jgi:SAM-dependent methyltransferase
MTLRDLVRLPVQALRLLASGAPALQTISNDVRRGTKTAQEALKRADASQRRLDAVDERLGTVREDVRELRREVHERLLQYHLQLGRLARAVDGAAVAETRLSGRSVPVDGVEREELRWASIGGDSTAPPDPEGREWDVPDSCPACGHTQRTVVNPWNKFILTEKAPDAAAVRYDYAVCHGCGVLYASRRPRGGRYRFLLEHFGEVTAKRGGTAEIPNRVLNPYPLSDADRAELDRLAKTGVFVSDHLGLSSKEYLAPLLRDRLENSVHVDIIGRLVNPRNGRVLEVRSRTGTILDGLRHAYGTDVYAMPIWESQQYLLQAVYGITTSNLIDFERFEIPFGGAFDVIVCNHMFTHVLRPRDFFAELHRRLKPGGYIYLHNEPDDVEFLEGQQSMLATLNPLHLQAFDQRSLVRALEANGFETVFLKRRHLAHMCLARATDPRRNPMDDRERDMRIDAYRRAFSIVRCSRSMLGCVRVRRPSGRASWRGRLPPASPNSTNGGSCASWPDNVSVDEDMALNPAQTRRLR